MKKLYLASLLLCAWLLPSAANAQGITRLCVETISANGAPNCVEGWAPKLLNGLTATVVAVKTSGGVLGSAYCYNASGAVAYLQIFDVATASGVTVGTTVPKLSFGIPNNGLNGWPMSSTIGIQFLNGIQVASTTTATGSSTATMDCNVTYN